AGIGRLPSDRLDLEQRDRNRIEGFSQRLLDRRARVRLGTQDHNALTQASNSFRIDSGALASRSRARPSGVLWSPQSNTARSSIISLPFSLNSCARILKSPSSSTQKAATGEEHVAPSARVNARSDITQS